MSYYIELSWGVQCQFNVSIGVLEDLSSTQKETYKAAKLHSSLVVA